MPSQRVVSHVNHTNRRLICSFVVFVKVLLHFKINQLFSLQRENGAEFAGTVDKYFAALDLNLQKSKH